MILGLVRRMKEEVTIDFSGPTPGPGNSWADFNDGYFDYTLYFEASKVDLTLNRVETSSQTAMPAQATVRLRIDADVLMERSIEPDYQTTEPNGPGCGYTHGAGYNFENLIE